MILADTLTLDAPRRTSDGYLVTRARAARAGIYAYLGREVDPTGKTFAADQIVNVYRPESEVFDQASVASFLMKPVTDNHPSQPVTADNWRQYAKGIVGKALRDGEHLAFDLVLMDAATIQAVESGKRELSNGYACDLAFESGTTPKGERYDAVQRGIRGNHVAVVDKGRAGPTCRIGDAAPCAPIPSEAVKDLLDERTYSETMSSVKNDHQRRETVDQGTRQMATKTITFDGLPLEVTDAAEAAINKLNAKLSDAASAKDKAETMLADANKALETEKGKVAALEQQVKDAAMTPEKLETMVADRAALVTKAKAVLPTLDAAGKTDADIRRAVVAAKLGDVAGMSDEAIEGAFAAFAKDAKPADPLRDAIRDTKAPVFTDARANINTIRAARYN